MVTISCVRVKNLTFVPNTSFLILAESMAPHGEGNGNPLQCSCLENPRDRGVWWAAVYGVTQSRTRLKRLSSSSSSMGPPPLSPRIPFLLQCMSVWLPQTESCIFVGGLPSGCQNHFACRHEGPEVGPIEQIIITPRALIKSVSVRI